MNKNWLYRVLALALVAMMALPMFALAEDVPTEVVEAVEAVANEEEVALVGEGEEPAAAEVNDTTNFIDFDEDSEWVLNDDDYEWGKTYWLATAGTFDEDEDGAEELELRATGTFGLTIGLPYDSSKISYSNKTSSIAKITRDADDPDRFIIVPKKVGNAKFVFSAKDNGKKKSVTIRAKIVDNYAVKYVGIFYDTDKEVEYDFWRSSKKLGATKDIGIFDDGYFGFGAFDKDEIWYDYDATPAANVTFKWKLSDTKKLYFTTDTEKSGIWTAGTDDEIQPTIVKTGKVTLTVWSWNNTELDKPTAATRVIGDKSKSAKVKLNVTAPSWTPRKSYKLSDVSKGKAALVVSKVEFKGKDECWVTFSVLNNTDAAFRGTKADIELKDCAGDTFLTATDVPFHTSAKKKVTKWTVKFNETKGTYGCTIEKPTLDTFGTVNLDRKMFEDKAWEAIVDNPSVDPKGEE